MKRLVNNIHRPNIGRGDALLIYNIYSICAVVNVYLTFIALLTILTYFHFILYE